MGGSLGLSLYVIHESMHMSCPVSDIKSAVKFGAGQIQANPGTKFNRNTERILVHFLGLESTS